MPPALLENLLLFPTLLRRAGLPVSLAQSLAFLQALELVDLARREQVYHAARSLLVTRYESLRLFDTLFERFFSNSPEGGGRGHQRVPPAPRHDPAPRRRFLDVTYLASKAGRWDREIEIGDKAGTYSDLEALARKEFSTLSSEELVAVRRLIQEMRWRASLRRTRRWVADRGGSAIHLRRALRDAAKYGGVPFSLPRRSPKIKQRPVVLLADVSGSMEKYSRLVLEFFYSVAHSLKSVETFVFGTRLTRLTPELAIRNIDRALAEASSRVVDWSGGTRIGESLAAFNQRWGRRVLRRGAVVVIVSDGWERGEADLLRREMRHLQLRCHRLVWLNPLSGREGYEPRVEGMAAALSFVDDFLPIHNLSSLFQFAEHLAALRPRRGAPPRRSAPGPL